MTGHPLLCSTALPTGASSALLYVTMMASQGNFRRTGRYRICKPTSDADAWTWRRHLLAETCRTWPRPHFMA